MSSYKQANARLVAIKMLVRLSPSEGKRMYLSALGLAELDRLKQERKE